MTLKKKPLVIITRKLPDPVETRMFELFDARLNDSDTPMDNAALVEGFAVAEADRYILWPGQATAYKIGELKIKELRAKSKAALGEEFDLRRFHNAVLDNGPLPLNILEEQIDRWVVSEKQRVAKGQPAVL